jgi:hypothetical protein
VTRRPRGRRVSPFSGISSQIVIDAAHEHAREAGLWAKPEEDRECAEVGIAALGG